MKNKRLMTLALATTIMSSFAIAGDGIELGDDFVVNADAVLRPQATLQKGGNDSVALKDSTLTLSVTYKNFVRAVVTAKLRELFRENGINVDDPSMKFDEFIKEAYIEIRNPGDNNIYVGAQPVAIIIGKHKVAFGQHIKTLFSTENPLDKILKKSEVFGLTVRLEEGLFGADMVEASVFESKGGDLELGRINGASVRITKNFQDKLFVTGSYLTQDENGKREHRAALGLVYRDVDAGVMAWTEAVYMKDNATFKDSNYVVTGGILARVHSSTDVFVEFSIIDNLLKEAGLGVNVALTKNIALGAVVKYQDYEDGKGTDGWMFGLEATILLGTSSSSQFSEALFQ
jgi:hypothetical protein